MMRPAARSTIRFTSSAISRDRLSSSAPTVPSVHSNEAMRSVISNRPVDHASRHLLIFGERHRRAFDDRIGEKLGIAKRVRDAVGGQRILEVPGVADERPSATPALTEVTGAAGEAGQWPFAAGADCLRERGRRLMENAQEGLRNGRAAIISGQRCRRNARKHECLAIVRRNHTRRARRAVVPVVAVERKIWPVAVKHRGRVPGRRGRPARRRAGDGRAHSVRADDDISREPGRRGRNDPEERRRRRGRRLHGKAP